MTKDNQKILYEHYKALANNVKKSRGGADFKPIIRENAKKHMEEIDESFNFSKEVKKKEEK